MMEEYRSPFKLPEQEKPPECTNPSDAVVYPDLHARAGSPGASSVWGDACPVHSHQARAKKKLADPWLLWFSYREAYATTIGEDSEAARQELMSKMLSQVTAANPPDVPFEPPEPVKTKSWHDIHDLPARAYLGIAVVTALGVYTATWLVLALCFPFS